MNDITDEAEKMLEGLPDGPWLYRPEAYDDWGWVRLPPREDGPGWVVALVSCSRFTEDELGAHRWAGTDPCRELGEFIAWSRTGVPALIAENKRLREALTGCNIAITEALELIEKHVPVGALGYNSDGDFSVPGGARTWPILDEHTHYIGEARDIARRALASTEGGTDAA